MEVLKKQLTLSESTAHDLRNEIRQLQKTVEQLVQENRELKDIIQVSCKIVIYIKKEKYNYYKTSLI